MTAHDIRMMYKAETGKHSVAHTFPYWESKYIAWLEKKLIEVVERKNKHEKC